MRSTALTRASRRRAGAALDAALRVATAPILMRHGPARRLWGRLLAEREMPDRLRARLTRRVSAAMLGVGDRTEAAAVGYAAAARLRDPRPKADLLIAAAAAATGDDDLVHGLPPAPVRAAAAAEFAAADAAMEAGRPRAAAASLARAMAILFHRELHFDRLSSALAEDPAGYLAGLRASRAVQALTDRPRLTAPRARRGGSGFEPRGREQGGAGAVPVDRPLRLLVATRANAAFLGEIRQRYGDLPGVELRFLDLAADPVREPLTRQTGELLTSLLGGGSSYGAEIERWLRPHLDWADVAFVDWCVATAALFTLVDPGDTRVVVRLHSFELFTMWPHLVNFARVDDLVFVSEHMRRFARAVVPALAAAHAPRQHVIPNAMNLHRYRRPKSADARFTLGLVGVGSVAKDPLWALEVLRLLRAHDPRYRLLLVGGMGPGPTESTRRYYARLERGLAEAERSGAVRRLGHTDDVPAALAEVGVILSTSVRESFHCALAEGAASGAVAAVRDWPFFARYGGARTIYPDDWVVASPERAADRILRATATESGWRSAGEATSRLALATWDWPVVQRLTDALFLGAAQPPSGAAAVPAAHQPR